MNKPQAFLVGTVAILALGAAYFPGSKKFAAIDRCLESGRAWNYRAAHCELIPAGPVDRLIVDKSERMLMAYRGGELVREFRVALGRGGVAPKRRQGDGRVPEGAYLIIFHNEASRFHRSLKIGYPTTEERDAARIAGIKPGGDIMIHGLPNGMGKIGSRHVRRNWTEGCIAVTNKEIEWLFEVVPDNTPVEIRA